MIKPDTKIQSTEISKRIKNILSKCNIFTIENLMNCDLARLKIIRGLGENSIREIVTYTHKHGCFFKD